jgi:hypothetical protein
MFVSPECCWQNGREKSRPYSSKIVVRRDSILAVRCDKHHVTLYHTVQVYRLVGECAIDLAEDTAIIAGTTNRQTLRLTMVKVQYDFDIEGALPEDPYLDSYEISLMFEQTKQSMGNALERKLVGITCEEHGDSPTITITGRYNGESEQLDINYHIDTCCKMFMVQVVKMLNTVN